MSNEIDEALVDVKKAYRLIYLYMRSVRDTVEKISYDRKWPLDLVTN